MEKIRVLIADDTAEIVNYFAHIIRQEEDIEVAGLAFSGEEAVAKVRELNPHIVLMDIQMETKTAGIDAIEKIREFNPAIKTIILTIHSRDDLIFKAYTVGAMDYIIKTSPVEEILSSIRAVASNTLMLRPEIANRILGESRRISETQSKVKEVLKVMMKISNTEYEIIKMAYDGYPYKKIAEQRFVEETTIRSEIYWILKKFNKKKMKDVITLLKEINFFALLES
ncbi:DNA-binding response regulator [Spirochaetia bacterium]|nr:DNA-binding response regulator [Spirochaetia bacterium]GHV57613.1 DNA-binding response regulator [Spirochaetia bacterium]